MFWLWMTARIVANPISNVFQKKLTQGGIHPLMVVCGTHGLLALACFPTLFSCTLPNSTEFWLSISICTVLNIAGNSLLIQAVKLSDLSIIGPINAYRPVVSLIPSFFLLQEAPGLLGIAGITLIVAGSYFLADKEGAAMTAFVRLAKDRGVQFRFAALLATALEAVFLKKVVIGSTPWVAFALWSVLGFVGAGVLVIIVLRKSFWRLATSNNGCVPLFVWLALTTGLMQLRTIIVLADFQVGYSLALFQTSAIISVVLGHRIFQEPHFLKRLIGSAVMAAGATLIIVGS